MMSYKSPMTDAQRNPTDSFGTSETIQPNPTIRPTFVSADSYPQNSTPYLMATKLSRHNYLEWAQSIKLASDGRGKIGHLTGEISKPAAGDPNKKKWQSENSLVIAWLINSMEPAIEKPHLFLPTTKDVWEAVRDLYLDLENSSQIFELKTRLWKSKQYDRNVTTYYNELVTLWQELDQCYDDVWKNSNNSACHKKREEKGRVYMFLDGLNRNLDEVRGPVLGRKPLPSIREFFFSEVRREESRRRIMLHNTESGFNLELDSSALMSRGVDSDNDGRKKPWCEHCKKPWHTKETCWKLYGKPANWKPKSKRDGRAYQATTEET
jgi:hypothetical protein